MAARRLTAGSAMIYAHNGCETELWQKRSGKCRRRTAADGRPLPVRCELSAAAAVRVRHIDRPLPCRQENGEILITIGDSIKVTIQLGLCGE